MNVIVRTMDARALKISQTMRARKLDNFKHWRDEQKRKGLIKSEYPPLQRNGDLAELIGCILGDGHIHRHERCDSLRIAGNFKNTGFTSRYAMLIEKVFRKRPAVAKVRTTGAVTITIYERHISKRLDIPHGDRGQLNYVLPVWIERSRKKRIRFLRGLYEAEGSECHHLPTSTHKLFFANHNTVLLDLVTRLVQELGFKTNTGKDRVQVSRKQEVQNLVNLLEFRHYEP
jgi:hypothetical protein